VPYFLPLSMEKNQKLYSIPVLRKGKEVKIAPKGSTKAAEQAKQKWYVEYFFINPDTGNNDRFRISDGLNRIKEPAQKLELFEKLLKKYNSLLERGYSPFSDNIELKNSSIVLTLKDAKELYIQYHINKKSRPRTLTSFTSKAKMVVDYFGENKKVTDITTVDVTNMMLKLEADGKWTGKTFINSRLAFVNFFNFLKNTGRIPKSPFEDFKEKRKALKSTSHQLFSDEDFISIKQWLANNDKYTLFCLSAIYYTCVRPAELRLLQIKHIDLARGQMTIPAEISKNKISETLSLDAAFIQELKNIRLNEYPSDYYLTGSTIEIVGVAPQPEKKAYSGLQACFKALKLLGKGYTLYSAKHLSNVRKRRAGWEIEEIQVANRHRSTAQTEIYLRDLMKDVKINKAIPSM
jgi:integrase